MHCVNKILNFLTANYTRSKFYVEHMETNRMMRISLRQKKNALWKMKKLKKKMSVAKVTLLLKTITVMFMSV